MNKPKNIVLDLLILIIFIETFFLFYMEIRKSSSDTKQITTENSTPEKVEITRPTENKAQNQNNVTSNDLSTKENKKDVIQQSSNQEYDSHIPTIIKITENKKKWKTFRDEKNIIQFRYPPELSLNKSRRDIMIGLYTISPEDAKNIPDAQIMNQLIVYTKEEPIDKIIEEQKTNNPEHFTQETVKINNIKTEKTSYRGAFAGELWINILIKNGSDTIVFSYPEDCEENRAIFEKIIATIKLLD
ncbi:MAG: hypothetical protein UR66_C0023G0005 [Candidatus Moranbacteria bacterium GW2011_GWE1_35_17]|nr:MAG: hypothetical protein UR66_C0023G0005 [Candidatus Moranbacteria bacterium GW2011_GWE1_35_17]